MTYEKGHGQYIVTCYSDNCLDVFKSPGLPRLGEPHHGLVVTDMRAERLTTGIYLISLRVDPVK